MSEEVLDKRKIRIYSYNTDSEGSKALSNALGIKRIRHNNSTFKGSESKTVINWGSSQLPEDVAKCRIINKPQNVSMTTNKLSFYQSLNGKFDPDLLVPWTSDLKIACSWLKTTEDFVVARTVLNGSGGNGIVMMHKDDPDSFVKAQLYTKYVKKSDEYRVHVLGGKIFLTQRKGLRKTHEDGTPVDPSKVNFKIRNLAAGFVFVRGDFVIPDAVTECATKIYEPLGLDFYAADIIYNKSSNRAYVLEVNTAPGLVGSTVDDYKNAFEEYLK